MEGKNVLITSGGCLEKWDNVRGHTNLAKGTVGKLIAEEALEHGANVIYLHGYFSAKPEAGNQQNLQLQSFEGIQDLQEQMKKIITQQKIDVVIMAAAGSDWVVDYMVNQNGDVISPEGKISSDNPPIIHLKKAPKVLRQIKSWNPDLLLVGFKLESNLEKEALVERADTRMREAEADYMIANSSDSLYTNKATHYILDKEKTIRECKSKEETSKVIVQAIKTKLLK